MSHSFILGLNAVYMSGCAIYWCVLLFRPSWGNDYHYWFGPVYVVCSFLVAVHSLLERDWFGTVLFSIYALIGAWSWWDDDEHKRRRRKLLDRAAGVVRDAGGRLKVVRPAER